MQDEETGAAATAGDEHANDEYAVTAAEAQAPPPPETFTSVPEPDAEPDGGVQDGPEPDADDGKIAVADASREQLELAIDEAELDVKGTGSGGYVTVEDMQKALTDAGVTRVEKVE